METAVGMDGDIDGTGAEGGARKGGIGGGRAGAGHSEDPCGGGEGHMGREERGAAKMGVGTRDHTECSAGLKIWLVIRISSPHASAPRPVRGRGRAPAPRSEKKYRGARHGLSQRCAWHSLSRRGARLLAAPMF